MVQGLAVVVDTDVYSRLFVSRAGRSQADAWRRALLGASVVIAVQTRAEILAGALIKGWGEQRLRQTREQLDRTATLPVDGAVVEAFAQLTADCRRLGHALHDKQHTADRWVAATAIAHDLPLLSGDGIFSRAPGLRLVEEVAR